MECHEKARARILALTLLMAGVLAANDHDLAVTANDLALVTHGFYRRSDFHDVSPLWVRM